MRRIGAIAAIGLSVAAAVAVVASGRELIEELVPLEPLAGTSWIGRFTSTPSPPYDHRIEWNAILSGHVVQWRKRVDELGFAMETFFYWDRELDAVAFTQLTSNGIHAKGIVESSGSGLTLVGVAMQPTGLVSFRQTLEMLEDGTLEDRYFRRAGDAWLPEHVIIYHPNREADRD